MDMIILCFIIYTFLIIVDVIPIHKEKKVAEVWFYSFILLGTFIIHILYSLGVTIPSPAEPIKMMVESIMNIWS
ncbi:hypothetical protein HLPCO_000920 [Haloplasma contractile SSD-17B]|uniref:Uncharacterized protein n=1 Tax=Haloplasma contractile SSD-17B TaxID=1033810 RepID=U2EF25_9MOLU|nr:hypothetical protein HLPCO_000920 [Haloplasma contractile SSD-17B]